MRWLLRYQILLPFALVMLLVLLGDSGGVAHRAADARQLCDVAPPYRRWTHLGCHHPRQRVIPQTSGPSNRRSQRISPFWPLRLGLFF